MIKRLLLAVLLVGLTPLVASAKNNPGTDSDRELQCDPSPKVTASPYQNAGFPRSGNNATATVTIETRDDLPACEPVKAVLVSYTAEGPTWPTSGHQEAFDHDTVSTTEPGVHTLSVQFPPTCWFQIDFDEGLDYPRTIDYPVDSWEGELIAYENGTTPGGCDEPTNPPPTTPPPPPEPVNHPRASVTGPGCEDRPVFQATLNNEHSDETVTFLLKLNGKTLRSVDVPDGKTEQITVHAEDGDRLQVFAPNQLAEADADLGKCEEPKDREHKSTTNGGKDERRSSVPTKTAATGASTGFWIALFIVLALGGIASLVISKLRETK